MHLLPGVSVSLECFSVGSPRLFQVRHRVHGQSHPSALHGVAAALLFLTTSQNLLMSHASAASYAAQDLWTDASPQWAGTEIVASSLERVLYSGWAMVDWIHRRSPCLQVGAAHLTALGKLYGLVHQLWLEFGPTYSDWRKACSKVIGICTDQGVERLIANEVDIVPTYCFNNGIPLPADYRVETRTFPLAIHAPGWAHLVDGLLRRFLGSQSWWQSFIKGLKALVKIARVHREVLLTNLKDIGEEAACEVLRDLKTSHFIVWRWMSLHRATSAALSVHMMLKDSFGRLRDVKKLRDITWTATVQENFNKRRPMANHVFKVSKLLKDLCSWGAGCQCLAERRDLKAGLLFAHAQPTVAIENPAMCE